MGIEQRGLAFDQATIAALEQALTDKGFDPNEFTVEKQRRQYQAATYALNIEYDYTVTIAGKRFSITFSDDEQFARFLYRLCCSPDDHMNHPVEDAVLRLFKRLEHSVEITKHWLTEDVSTPNVGAKIGDDETK